MGRRVNIYRAPRLQLQRLFKTALRPYLTVGNSKISSIIQANLLKQRVKNTHKKYATKSQYLKGGHESGMASHERLGNRRAVKPSNFPLIVTDQFYKLLTLSYYTLSYYILSLYILFPTEYSFLFILFPTDCNSFFHNTFSY